MKILFVATVRSHIGQFHMPFIKKLKELGCRSLVHEYYAFRKNETRKRGSEQ